MKHEQILIVYFQMKVVQTMNYSIKALFFLLLVSVQVKASFDDQMLDKMTFAFYDVLSDGTCKPSEKRWMSKSQAAGICLAIWAVNNEKMHSGLVIKGLDATRIQDYTVKKHTVRFFKEIDKPIFAEYDVALQNQTKSQVVRHILEHVPVTIK